MFENLNVGYARIGAERSTTRGCRTRSRTVTRCGDATVPTITITGITAPFGDVFGDSTRLRTLELRDILTLDRGKHALRPGVEVRRITKGLAMGSPQMGTFTFNSVAEFVADRPFRQTLTVDPITGEPTAFPRYFTLNETAVFIDDQWTVCSG